MNIAITAFVIGCVIAFVSAVRLFIRAYVEMHRLGRTLPNDPIYQLIGNIRLRNTAIVELVGCIAGFLLAHTAVRFI